jgi:hypothetical protein
VYRYFYPGITPNQFEELRVLDDFKSDMFTVCDTCYVDLLGHKICGGNELINKYDSTSKFFGAGMLMPENGVKRYLQDLEGLKPNFVDINCAGRLEEIEGIPKPGDFEVTSFF